MALKGDRSHLASHVDFTMNDTTAERGGIVSVVGSGSGVSMDDSNATVGYVANPSGVSPVGILMGDTVNNNLTRLKLNPFKLEHQTGTKAPIWSKGVVTTDRVYPGHSPTAGGLAYVGHSGYIAASDVATDSANASTTRIVGRWLSAKDEDGFAKVSINLP